MVPIGNGYRGPVLIIVPPSETKAAPPARGEPVDLEALIRTSADLDAFERLRLRPTFAAEVVRNTRLFEVPAMPVLDVYTGPFHEGLAWAQLSPKARRWTDSVVVVYSPLWGLLRPPDRIPPYRLGPWVTLLGVGRIDHVWRAILPAELARTAGRRGLVVDLRSAPTQSSGMPAGIGNRTVILRVDQGTPGNRIGDVIAKRVRGQAAQHLLESAVDPDDPHELAEALSDRWPVRLEAGLGRNRPWTMTLRID